MKISVYDPKGNYINTISEILSITKCNDGRHLINMNKKCETCGHNEVFTTQVPANYEIVITMEVGDEFAVKDK